LIGTTVSESVFYLMQKHPGSISGFYEDAVAAFDGNLTALVEAAVLFVKQRKLRAVRRSRSGNPPNALAP
jgi:hypothetical protein